MRPMSAAGQPTSVTSKHSNVINNFNNTGQMPSQLKSNSNMNSSGLLSNVTNQGLWQKGSDHTIEIMRQSA